MAKEKAPESSTVAAPSAKAASATQQKSIEAALEVAKKTVLDLQQLLNGQTQGVPMFATVLAKGKAETKLCLPQ